MKELIASAKDVFWKEDPQGFFTIVLIRAEKKIHVRYYKNHTLEYVIIGDNPEHIYFKILSLKLISRMEHAAYLGKELEKAYLALKNNLDYVQDNPLDLAQKPQKKERKIISLAPSNTEILYELGLGKNIIANTRFCDYPRNARKKKKIGGWIDINLKEVKRMNADIVLTSTIVQNKIVKEARQYNINIVHLNPKTLDDVFKSILTIGEITNTKEKAEKLVASMQKKQNKILKKIIFAKRPRVYIEEWHQPPHVSGNWVPKLVEMAGGDYKLCAEGVHSRKITDKEVQNYDPEIIILSLCGFGNKTDKEILTKRPGWENLDAVRNGRVYIIDDSLLNRPGPRLVEGLKFLVKVINRYKKGKK